MNIGYIFDVNGILNEEDLHIPYLDGLHYIKIDLTDLTVAKVVETRRDVMKNIHATIEKHQFFFVINNDNKTLTALSNCINSIQTDRVNFNVQNNEVHVVCNFVDEKGFGIEDYEKGMPCLTNNTVCIYSWLLDINDNNGDRKIEDPRRAHAIARLAWMLCKHRVDLSLKPIVYDNNTLTPIYNLFGDACVFFDEEKRTKAVRDYYSFKSIQHLLNLSDTALSEYMRENVLPYAEDKKKLDKRIDTTTETFLENHRIPIEASVITEKTQKLLIKNDKDDEEYLVNATDNKLVFIEELAQSNGWQLEGMDSFLSEYQAKVGLYHEVQETVSEDFIEQLYRVKYITHERDGFDKINNRVSESRRTHIDRFKQSVEHQMNAFLNLQEDGHYAYLQNPLTTDEVAKHHNIIDYGIAFLGYLDAGKGEGLVDQEVSMGDINFTKIKEKLETEEKERRLAYEEKKKEIAEKYKPQDDGKPSKVREEFEKMDKSITLCRDEKRKCEYQLYQWFDQDADKKLTAKSKAWIAMISGILVALLFLFVSIEYFSDINWYLFSAVILAGIVIGVVLLYNAHRRLQEAEAALEGAIQRKRNYMHKLVKEMDDVTKKHYDYLLAYHGLKTMKELINFAVWKKEELVFFKKTLFKLMIQYWLSADACKNSELDDENTFELTDSDAKTLLFGTDNEQRVIPYCFAQSNFVMSETFNEFKRKKARFDTSRDSLNFTSRDYDRTELEKETIACMREHENVGIKYSTLKETSILPANTSDIEIDDIHQGSCGDCYFMATLAAIARINPDYIIGKNGMIEELDEDHRFFRVKFYNKDGKRVNVDIDNRFWVMQGEPYYAKRGVQAKDAPKDCYDPWVMAVEKAWAKVNGDGYDGIEGARRDGKEVERQVEYSFAVTGKSAFYCRTKDVDAQKLGEMMKKHFNEDKLPITLYSVNEGESDSADDYIVNYHAYALRTANDDGTFDIFNPWNTNNAKENIRGKHYENVGIQFIKDNFCVVVFFGIKEADFDSFERDLTQNAAENEVARYIEKIFHDRFDELKLPLKKMDDLLSEESMETLLTYSNYLFSKNRIKNSIGVEGKEIHFVFLEGGKTEDCKNANEKMTNYLSTHLSSGQALRPMLLREDEKQILTIFRLSPHYLLSNFHY